MSQISDEMIMAYADGELGDDDRRAVEAYLAGNPAAAARLRAFEVSGRSLARLYDDAMRQPVPAYLVETVRTAKVARPVSAGLRAYLAGALGSVVAAPSALPMTAALACALLAGGAAGWGIHALSGPQRGSTNVAVLTGGGLVASAALQRALETMPSGRPAPEGNDQRFAVTPRLSFLSQSGRYCRQYEMGAPQFAGVSCRSPDGEWRIELHMPARALKASNDRIAPAGGPASAIESAIDAMIKGDALGPDEEAQLIAKGWHRDP